MTVLGDAVDVLAGSEPVRFIQRGQRIVWSSESYAQLARELGALSFQNGATNTLDPTGDAQWVLAGDQETGEGPWRGLQSIVGESGYFMAQLDHAVGDVPELSISGWVYVADRFWQADPSGRAIVYANPFSGGVSLSRAGGSEGYRLRGRYMSQYGTPTDYAADGWAFFYVWQSSELQAGGWSYYYDGDWYAGDRTADVPTNSENPQLRIATPGQVAGVALFPRLLDQREIQRLFMAREGIGTVPGGAQWAWQVNNNPPAGVWGVVGGADFLVNNTDVDGNDRAAFLATFDGRRVRVVGDNGAELTSPEPVVVANAGATTTQLAGQTGWNRAAFTDAFPAGTILTVRRIPNPASWEGRHLQDTPLPESYWGGFGSSDGRNWTTYLDERGVNMRPAMERWQVGDLVTVEHDGKPRRARITAINNFETNRLTWNTQPSIVTVANPPGDGVYPVYSPAIERWPDVPAQRFFGVRGTRYNEGMARVWSTRELRWGNVDANGDDTQHGPLIASGRGLFDVTPENGDTVRVCWRTAGDYTGRNWIQGQNPRGSWTLGDEGFVHGEWVDIVHVPNPEEDTLTDFWLGGRQNSAGAGNGNGDLVLHMSNVLRLKSTGAKGTTLDLVGVGSLRLRGILSGFEQVYTFTPPDAIAPDWYGLDVSPSFDGNEPPHDYYEVTPL